MKTSICEGKLVGGKLIKNDDNCIGVDYPKELGGTFLSREAIEYIKILKKDGVEMSNKEQLLKELEQVKNQQKELAKKIETIQKQIEAEDNKKEWWIPKEGEGYYYICTDGYVQGALNTGVDIDKCKINNINCYQTGQQAERQAFEELLHRKLKKFAYLNNSEMDWNNDNSKYYIGYDNNYKQICIYDTVVYKHIGQVYFTSEEIADKAIEEFKDDLLRYFTSDK